MWERQLGQGPVPAGGTAAHPSLVSTSTMIPLSRALIQPCDKENAAGGMNHSQSPSFWKTCSARSRGEVLIGFGGFRSCETPNLEIFPCMICRARQILHLSKNLQTSEQALVTEGSQIRIDAGGIFQRYWSHALDSRITIPNDGNFWICTGPILVSRGRVFQISLVVRLPPALTAMTPFPAKPRGNSRSGRRCSQRLWRVAR